MQKLATMRRDFVANVSHELKTPLTVTLGFIETAQDALQDTPPADIARYLQTAGDQARRMQQLIEDLLTLSALETNAPPPLDDRVGVTALLEDILQEVRTLSGGRHRIVLENTGPTWLLGGVRELRSAFANLAGNAVRYSPDGGDITVGWCVDGRGGGARFWVRDSGIGIAGEHLPRLTERFYRVDGARSRHKGGTGLGLAITRHIVMRHRGRLAIESTEGVGTTVRVWLPIG